MRRFYLPFFLLSIALLASCSDDDDKGTSCTVDDFVGVWDMVEQCGGSDFQYALTITETSSGLTLTNLGGLGVNSVVPATVNGSSFTFAQTVQGSAFSGNGSLNAGCAQLTVNWQGGPNGTCGSTGTK